MKTLILLVIWGQLGGNSSAPYGWIPIGEFVTVQHCETAAGQLKTNNPKQVFRCLDTGKKAPT